MCRFCLFFAILLTVVVDGCKRHNKAWEKDEGLASEDPNDLEGLQALGYIDFSTGVPDASKNGSHLFAPGRVQPGFTLYDMPAKCSARLVDLAGTLAHEWGLSECTKLRAVELLPGGDLAAVGFHDDPQAGRVEFVTRLSWAGERRWRSAIRGHHDIELLPDGNLLVLTTRERTVAEYPRPILDEYLTYLSADGSVVREVSIYDMLTNNTVGFVPMRGKKWKRIFDVTHANSVNSFHDPELAEKSPLFAPGNVVVAMRNQNSVFIFDPRQKALLWAWGHDEIDGPHDATVVGNGNILLFDNGLKRRWSRVVEVDPLSRRIVWEYRHRGDDDFFSRSRGAAQRLANGNTLICNSNSGQAVEVTPDGQVVWDLNNPVTNQEGRRAVMIRARRLSDAWLGELVRTTATKP